MARRTPALRPVRFTEPLRRLAVFAAIAAVVCVTFYPSLFHIARADHWDFLFETVPYDSWAATVNDFYSYARVRTMNRGDVQLFRPLLFGFMGTEVYLFGWNFMWWQITGVVLHLAAVYALLRLLWAIHRGMFAGLLTLFFATLFIGHMAVTWQHINGYVLYMVFTLWALYHLYTHVDEGQVHAWRLWAMAGLVLAAGLTYEAGNAQGPVFALCLWCAGRSAQSKLPALAQWRAVLLCVPLVIYGIWDFVDFRYVHPTLAELWDVGTGDLFRDFALIKTAGNIIAVPLAFLYGALFPALQQATCGTGLEVRPFHWAFARSFSFLSSPFACATASITAAWILVAGWTVMRRLMQRPRAPSPRAGGPGRCFGLAILALLAAQIVLVVIGRANTRGLVTYVFAESSYYAYLVMPLLIVLCYFFCMRVGCDAIVRAAGPAHRIICVMMLAGLSLINAGKVYQINERVRQQYPARPGMLLEHVDKLRLHTYYQCLQDPQHVIIMVLMSYAHIRHGFKETRLGHHPDAVATNMAIAAQVIPLNQDFINAIELDDKGEFEQAIEYLNKARMAGDVHPLIMQIEHCIAALGRIGQCSAAIARDPHNPVLYAARARLYFGTSTSIDRARRDIEQVRKLGGIADQQTVDALRMSTNDPLQPAAPRTVPPR